MATYAFLGDVHGHLQLALCTLARWQRERGEQLAGVFLAGDVGTFTEDAQLDSATRKHARENPCELEFMTQWATHPPAPWVERIFRPEPEGLGLCCPVVMVHGNHEGFAHLETLFPRRNRPTGVVAVEDLPTVDTGGWVRLLPPGWVTVTEAGHTVGGVGGIEPGQRRAKYHPMAYIDEDAVEHLAVHAPRPLDALLTHQGPAAVQGDHGSETLDLLLEGPTVARYWFHGHSTPVGEVTEVAGTAVVPLGDLAFHRGEPGLRGWSFLRIEGERAEVSVEEPAFWREVRLARWVRTPQGWAVHPELAGYLR